MEVGKYPFLLLHSSTRLGQRRVLPKRIETALSDSSVFSIQCSPPRSVAEASQRGSHTRVLSAHAIHHPSTIHPWTAWKAWKLEKAEGLAWIDWAWSSASSVCGARSARDVAEIDAGTSTAYLITELSVNLTSRLKPQSVASIRDTAGAGPQGRGRWCLDETAQHWHSPRARRGRRTRRRK